MRAKGLTPQPVILSEPHPPGERRISTPRGAKGFASGRPPTDWNHGQEQGTEAMALERALQRAQPLSPEDADRLAQALVYVSKLDGVPPMPEEPSETDHEAKPAAPLIRLATDDPNVVIYWQIDSNGG
jgi:hypothetical protein